MYIVSLFKVLQIANIILLPNHFLDVRLKKINISLPGSCYWRIKKLENKSQFQKLYSNYSMQKYIYFYQVQIVDRNGLIMNVIKLRSATEVY